MTLTDDLRKQMQIIKDSPPDHRRGFPYTNSPVISEHHGISPTNLVPYKFTGTSKEHAEYFDGLMEQRKRNCEPVHDMKVLR